nr:MAG TPA: hypothetical protein [Caudoviricetes sp.]
MTLAFSSTNGITSTISLMTTLHALYTSSGVKKRLAQLSYPLIIVSYLMITVFN